MDTALSRTMTHMFIWQIRWPPSHWHLETLEQTSWTFSPSVRSRRTHGSLGSLTTRPLQTVKNLPAWFPGAWFIRFGIGNRSRIIPADM